MSDVFPTAFGRYQLIERLAVGGMAELFKARVVGSHGFQKPVVIKKILPHLAADESFVAMFIDEANITARLDHPKIAQVLELGNLDGQLFIAMEFVDGLDVLALLRGCAQRKQPLPAHLAAHIAHEVLDALEYAHQAHDESGRALGIVHRDISPSNVLVSRRGDVKLADFGIAHAVERQQKTQTGTLKGKYGYMSPEQVVGGDIDGRSDLFSVGIVLAEMLMGRRLFTAPNDLDVLLMVRDVRLERLEKYGASLDPDLKEILNKAFARELKNRYETAGEFRDALSEWLYAKRQRVTQKELATFIDELFGGDLPKPAGSGSQTSAQQAPSSGPSPPAGTLVGPSTKAQQLRVEEAQRAARAMVAERTASQSDASSSPVASGSSPMATPRAATPPPVAARAPAATPSQAAVALAAAVVPANAPAPAPKHPAVGARAHTVPAHRAATPLPQGGHRGDRRQSTEIPIVLDFGDDEPLGGIVLDEALGEESVPVLMPTEVADPDLELGGGTSPELAPSRTELDFSSLSMELDLDLPPRRPSPSVPRPSPLMLEPVEPPAPPRVGIITEHTDEEGDLSRTPPIRLLYKLAVEKANGLLVVEISAITKEIYFAGGVPEFVSSNVARELLGEYLVAQKVISHGELAMALAMMPHFGGKLGDTLVGLGLMKPLDVFRHLTRQVRDKIIDVCSWQKGRYRWYRGKRNPREAFPLGLDAFEVLGAGATSLSAAQVDAWATPLAGRSPVAAKNPRVVPEAFRLGGYPREVYNRLDGRLTLEQHVGRISKADDRLAFLRALYLLVHTDLVQL